jgi:hypothetical protein
VPEKDTGNFCEYFDFARRSFVPKAGLDLRQQAARDQLKKLL